MELQKHYEKERIFRTVKMKKRWIFELHTTTLAVILTVYHCINGLANE